MLQNEVALKNGGIVLGATYYFIYSIDSLHEECYLIASVAPRNVRPYSSGKVFGLPYVKDCPFLVFHKVDTRERRKCFYETF
jgi:hypothetical protein